MPIDVRLPELTEGEDDEKKTVEEVKISFWYVDAGENVEEGENLVQVRTDKATFDVPAPASGKLSEVLAGEEQPVKPGELLGRIEEA